MHACLCALTSESFTARALLFPREGRSAGWGTASPKPLPDAVTALHDCLFFPCLFLPRGASLSVEQTLKKEMI